MSDDTEPDERQHVDESDEYSQMFGIVIGHPPQCDLFREVKDGYEIDATPNSDLRELIEEWRYENAIPAGQQGAYQVADAFEKCANELEALIDDDDTQDNE